jgi:thiamine pyrophosphate-dependent acetolactate synthase large subunit-like protein
MGSTLSVAIGVAIGQPNKKVRVVMGDGEFLMGINALYTLAALKLPNLTLIILNNKKYDQDGGLPTHWEKLSLKRVIVGAGLTYEKAATPKKLTAILEGPMAAQVIEVGVTGAGFKEKAETRPRIDPLAAKKNFQEYVQA